MKQAHTTKFKFRLFLFLMGYLFLCLLALASAEAQASCVGGSDQSITAAIDKAHAPVSDGSGYAQPGCILESDGKVLGYTSYNYLCHLPAGEKVDLRLSYGCCDSGPDSGDLVCTVRVKKVGGLISVHGNGVGLSPTEKDARAIVDLVEVLAGDFVFSYYGASKKLLEYLADDKFREGVLKKRERLKVIAKEGKHPDQRGYTAYVLLSMGNENEADTVEYIVRVLESEPVFDDINIPVIAKAANYPSHADKIAPPLLYFLKRQYYQASSAEAVFDALEKLGPSLRPYMKDLLEFEYEWSDRGSHYDFKERVGFFKRMNAIVCSIWPQAANELERHGVHYRDPPKTRFTCPPAD